MLLTWQDAVTRRRGSPMSRSGPKESAGPGRERYPGPWRMPASGCSTPFACLGGGLGWLADRALGTLPLFLFVGLLVGAGLGVLGTRAELRRYSR